MWHNGQGQRGDAVIQGTQDGDHVCKSCYDQQGRISSWASGRFLLSMSSSRECLSSLQASLRDCPLGESAGVAFGPLSENTVIYCLLCLLCQILSYTDIYRRQQCVFLLRMSSYLTTPLQYIAVTEEHMPSAAVRLASGPLSDIILCQILSSTDTHRRQYTSLLSMSNYFPSYWYLSVTHSTRIYWLE